MVLGHRQPQQRQRVVFIQGLVNPREQRKVAPIEILCVPSGTNSSSLATRSSLAFHASSPLLRWHVFVLLLEHVSVWRLQIGSNPISTMLQALGMNCDLPYSFFACNARSQVIGCTLTPRPTTIAAPRSDVGLLITCRSCIISCRPPHPETPRR